MKDSPPSSFLLKMSKLPWKRFPAAIWTAVGLLTNMGMPQVMNLTCWMHPKCVWQIQTNSFPGTGLGAMSYFPPPSEMHVLVPYVQPPRSTYSASRSGCMVCYVEGCWKTWRVVIRKLMISSLLPPLSFMHLQPSKPDWKDEKIPEMSRYLFVNKFLTNHFHRKDKGWTITVKSEVKCQEVFLWGQVWQAASGENLKICSPKGQEQT